MISILRQAGIGVAAVWLGGTAFFVLVLHPLLGETELLRLLGPLHAGDVAYRATDRFHWFQIVCASACVAFTLGDWLYSGRPLDKRFVGLLVLLLGLGNLGILGITPKCRHYSVQSYLGPGQQVQRQALTPGQRLAERSLAVWEGLGLTANIVSLLGVGIHFFGTVSAGKTRVRG